MQESVEYLGHIINKHGIHATQAKIEAIENVPVPQNVTELRVFLGLLNYYNKFLRNLSTIILSTNYSEIISLGCGLKPEIMLLLKQKRVY